MSAEQSKTTQDGSKALDLQFETYSKARRNPDGELWLKVSLNQVYCVEKVIRYKRSRGVLTEFTCSQTGCVCRARGEQELCEGVTLSVYVDQEGTGRESSGPNCRYGNTVKLEKDRDSTLTVYEISITSHLRSARGEIYFVTSSVITVQGCYFKLAVMC